MYLEQFKPGEDLKAVYNSLNSTQKTALFEEIKTKKESIEKERIISETTLKSLIEQKESIEKELFEKYGVTTLQEVIAKKDLMETEIIQGITDFVNATKGE